MKKTTILIRGYDCDFDITIAKKKYLTIELAERYVHKAIIQTAMIKGVVHHKENGDLIVKNKNYTLK